MKKLRGLILAAAAAGSVTIAGGSPASADGFVPGDCTVEFPKEAMTVRCTSSGPYQAVVRCSLGDYYNGLWQPAGGPRSAAACSRGTRTNWWINFPD